MPADERLTVLSLCSGIGGIDLGLERAGMRVVGQCELDAHCRAVLERHWPDVPCSNDVREVGASFGVTPDVIAAGFPCQPVSQAGRRLAQEDPRWLWPEVARVVRELRPRYVIVENVRGLLRRGFHDVVTDLARLGLDAQWGVLRASDVGAPHRRERIFLVAALPDADATGPQGQESARRHDVPAGSGAAEAATDADRASGEARGDERRDGERPRVQPLGRPAPSADADGERAEPGLGRGAASSDHPRPRPAEHDRDGLMGTPEPRAHAETPADSHGEPVDVGPGLRSSEQDGLGRGRPDDDAREDFDWGVYTDAIRRWEHVRGDTAPRPADEQRRLMPEFVEWMMGYEVGWTDGGSRVQRLKQVGNSVVPQCVELIGAYVTGRAS